MGRKAKNFEKISNTEAIEGAGSPRTSTEVEDLKTDE